MAFLKKTFPVVALVTLFLAQGALFFVIPSMGSSVFLSPDETANAVSARVIAKTGSAQIQDPILNDGSFLHPRSYVTRGDAMVPVGFLGLPILLAALVRLVGEWSLTLFVPLLVLSVAYPMWKLLAGFGRMAQVAGVMTWLAFPTVILYANRGLYPNLPVVCLTLWSAYITWERRSVPRAVVAGLLAGLAIAIRPIEVIWVLPWLALAWRYRKDRKQHQERRALLTILGSMAIPCLIAAVVAWKTYGSPFAVGYFLRDPVSSSIVAASPSTTGGTHGLFAWWPFGFHPRDMWFNFHSYFLGEWLPWTLLSGLAAAILWRRREMRIPLAVAAWTIFASILVYGQAIYQDHVGINVVSSGNSFLRYALPFAVIAALAVGVLWGEAALRKWHRLILASLLAVVVIIGTQVAFAGDDENILVTGQELSRYSDIRGAAFARFGPQLIVLSERSDKIFFPTFRVATPIPPMDRIVELVKQAPAPVGYYSETLSDTAMQPWKDAGLLLRPIFQNDNQTMYALSVAQASFK